MLTIDSITLRVAGRVLLENASAQIPTGGHVGLVGRNGAGKTTLFRAICGEHPTDSGRIALPPRARIGRVAQEAPSGPEALIDVVLAADVERAALIIESATATDPHRIAEIETRLADIGAHSAPARAARILAGLGFDEAAQQRPCSDFSGGWRMRVALAAVLFAEPDLLLLDEPTNYLDLEGTLWLQDYLARYPHTVLIISHDRDLLDQSVDWIAASGRRAPDAVARRLFGVRAPARREADARRQAEEAPGGPEASTCRPSSTASATRPPRRARPSRA